MFISATGVSFMTTALNNNLNVSVAAFVNRAGADSFARISKAESAPSGGRLPQWTGDVSPPSSTRRVVRSPKTTAKIPFRLLPILPNDKLQITLLPIPFAPGRKPIQGASLPVLRPQGNAMPRRRISANERTYRPASLATVDPTITLYFGPSTSKDAVRSDRSGKAGQTIGSAADPAPKLSAVQHEVHWSTRPHVTAR